jgi:hypothetical protein
VRSITPRASVVPPSATGLLRRGREAQRRPCQLFAVPLKGATEWLEEFRQFWEESLDRLDEYLRELKLKEQSGSRKKEKKHGRKK